MSWFIALYKDRDDPVLAYPARKARCGCLWWHGYGGSPTKVCAPCKTRGFR